MLFGEYGDFCLRPVLSPNRIKSYPEQGLPPDKSAAPGKAAAE